MSRFFLLGNAIIQLIRVTSRINGTVYPYRENYTSPCWIGKAHIDFWIDNKIDANYWIQDVENRAHALGGDGLNVQFNRPIPQQTIEDALVPIVLYQNMQTR